MEGFKRETMMISIDLLLNLRVEDLKVNFKLVR